MVYKNHYENRQDFNPSNRPITSQVKLGANSGEVALYNLHKDIGEQENLIGQEPEKAKELQQEFDLWMRKMKDDHRNYLFWEEDINSKKEKE